MDTDILGYWGTEKLHKYPRVTLGSISIPESSKDFLERVGLPIIDDLRFRFTPTESTFPIVDETQSLRQIGAYDCAQICIKEENGEVYWYDDDDNNALYMNSYLEAFVLHLTLYHQMLLASRGDTRAEARKEIVYTTEQQMRLIDSSAFAGTELFWSMIFEEIGYELT